MNIKNIRQLNQQLASPQYNDAHSIVSWLGMMQAQDYRTMPWAVGLRMQKPSYSKVKGAFDAGRIIRMHLFRNTVQLVPGEDVRWMLSLCAEKAIRAEQGFYRSQGITIEETDITRSQEILRELLAGGRALSKESIKAEFELRNLNTDNHRMNLFLHRAEYDGLICSGPIDGRFATFALLEEQVPTKVEFSREEALAILARKYFRSHAPATLSDFQWWTGLTIKECREAVSHISSELSEFQHSDETYYVHTESRTRGYRKEIVHLLPPYDEYLIGYKTRHHAVAPEHQRKAHNNFGIFYPIVISDGKVVGNWNAKTELILFDVEKEADFSSAIEKYRKFK
ncbi:MAG: winged helix DNA-binding domain-containing protein [Bacteroides sp.]|nr:winged helix DNA-binding domain-containing protein [Bacteroides sp.]